MVTGAQPRGPQRGAFHLSIGSAARVGCSGLLGIARQCSGCAAVGSNALLGTPPHTDDHDLVAPTMSHSRLVCSCLR